MQTKTIQKRKKEIVILSVKERITKLVNLFKRHKGEKKAIGQRRIFEYLYGGMENYDDLQVFYLWHQIRLSMNQTRKSTYCFIVSQKIKGIWKYYVPTNYGELVPYVTLLTTTKKKIDHMIARGQASIRLRYFDRI